MNELAVKGSPEYKFLKDAYAKDSTDMEFEMFMYEHKRLGIHPSDKKLYFQKRGGNAVHITSINLLLERADATGLLMGIPEPTFDGEPGKKGFVATQVVYKWHEKSKTRIEFIGRARWEEFYEKSSNFLKDMMPSVLLAKCALAQGLRKGFSAQMAGLYIAEELTDPPPLTVTSKDLAGDIAPDTWITGKFKWTEKGTGTTPATMTLYTENGDMTLSMMGEVEGLDDHYKKNEPVRFQYGKSGKFRVVTAIERIAQEVETVQVAVPQDMIDLLNHSTGSTTDIKNPQSETKAKPKADAKYKPGIPSPPEGFSSWIEALRSHLSMNYVGQAAQNTALVNATIADDGSFPGWDSMKALEDSRRPELMAKMALEKMGKA